MVLQHQTTSGSVPTPADLTDWAGTYGLTHPVVADPSQDTFGRWANGQPRYTLLAPGAVIVREGVSGISDADIEGVLPHP